MYDAVHGSVRPASADQETGYRLCCENMNLLRHMFDLNHRAGCRPARADIVYDAVRSSVRPATADQETAVVTLLDAKGTLLELKVHKIAPACTLAVSLKRCLRRCCGWVCEASELLICTIQLHAQALASTVPSSEERFRARRILPGMAKRLREARHI